MFVKVAFILGLFVVATVKSDVRQSDYPKTCQPGPAQASGGSLSDMVGSVFVQTFCRKKTTNFRNFHRQLFPCNVEQDTPQASENVDEFVSEASSQQYTQDARYDRKRSQEIALSVLDLSQRLTENIISKSSKKFEILSPISIASALQLALLGAHGMTFNELMDL
jgi:Serpin (serine protease inhibitor)